MECLAEVDDVGICANAIDIILCGYNFKYFLKSHYKKN